MQGKLVDSLGSGWRELVRVRGGITLITQRSSVKSDPRFELPTNSPDHCSKSPCVKDSSQDSQASRPTRHIGGAPVERARVSLGDLMHEHVHVAMRRPSRRHDGSGMTHARCFETVLILPGPYLPNRPRHNAIRLVLP